MKVLYIRNLMLSTTESTIKKVFSHQTPVKWVKKTSDYAFVYFYSKEDAHKAMNALNGNYFCSLLIYRHTLFFDYYLIPTSCV